MDMAESINYLLFNNPLSQKIIATSKVKLLANFKCQ